MAKHRRTHPIYLKRGINPLIPKLANVLAIKQNTPIGANFITMRVISIMTLFPCVKNSSIKSSSSLNFATIIPTSNPKMITGNMSPFANALNGLSGIMFKIVVVTVWFVVTFASAIPVIFKPTPG